MTWPQYLDYFNSILEDANRKSPYDDEAYFQYTKMNKSRTNRWLKHNPLTEATTNYMKGILPVQNWIVITEPWCGDAAHILPVLYLMSELNTNIHFCIQLRDEGSEIEQYLTNGTQSIPILIARDVNGHDLFRWGPRPKAAKELFEKLKQAAKPFEDIKTAIQEFYNKDKGKGVQEEVVKLLKELY